MTLFDTHAHLDYLVREGQTPEGVVQSAIEGGVGWIVNPSVNLSNIPDVLRMAEQFDGVYAGVAVHPTDVQLESNPNWLDQIEQHLAHPKVVAVGETGLDYYWDKSFQSLQHEFFRAFLALGCRYDLPVIVHSRESNTDVHQLISQVPGARGVMHCFSGDADFAQAMIALGFYISFAGNVTFKNAHALHEAAQQTPLEWILIETDSPFLSPVPFRGKPNEPARVKLVADKIATLKNIPVEDVIAVTTQNALKVFNRCSSSFLQTQQL